jgi:Rrf2 family protein
MSANCRFVTAVHVLTVLAYNQGASVSSAALAASVNTNPVMVRRLLLILQAANLVETRKGPGLGSRLSRSADRINLAEVYRAVEFEEPFAFPRKQPNRACPIGQGIRAVLERVCEKAWKAVERDLRQITLVSVLDGIALARPMPPEREQRQLGAEPLQRTDRAIGGSSRRKR